MTHSRLSWPWWRWVLTILILLALTLSAYLSWHHLMGGAMLGCGGGSPCDRVLNSRWSTVAGVLPVSGLAAGAYLAMLVASLFIGPATAAPVRRLAWQVMLVLAGAAAGSAVWFIVVQEWLVGALCPYCMTTHVTGLLLAALLIWRTPREFADNPTEVAPLFSDDAGQRTEDGEQMTAQPSALCPPPSVFRPPSSVLRRLSSGPIGPSLAGLALAGILVACQVAIKPRAAYRGGESQNNLPTLDPHAVPLVGSPDARYVVTLLFDYACPHCQQLHFMLDEAVRQYDGKLAFALCPTPLNTNCNPHIPRNMDEFRDSCELARVGLAVWAAKREAFPAFNRWMFSFESGDRWYPRSPDEARAKAIELVGQAKFKAAQADPWLDRYMQTCIQFYGATIQGGNGAVPKMLFGVRWVIPQPDDADDLVWILQNSLAVPAPQSLPQ